MFPLCHALAQRGMHFEKNQKQFEANNDLELAESLFSQGRNHLMRGRQDSAAIALDAGLALAAKIGNDELMVRFYVERAHLFVFSQKPSEGLRWLNRATPLIDDGMPYRLREKHLFLKGMFYQAMNKTDSAVHFYHLCEALNEKEDSYRNWLVYYQMGLLFQYSDGPGESEKYFLKAYSITKKTGQAAENLIVLNQLADLYYQAGNSVQFARYLEEMEAFRPKPSPDQPFDPLHSMVLVKWEKKEMSEKIAFMEAVHDTLLASGNFINAALAYNYIVGFLEEDKQYNRAIGYIRSNQKLFEEKNDLINLYANTRIAYRLLKKAGLYQQAMEEGERLLNMKDSIIQVQRRETMLSLEKKYETERKEREIALLNAENRLNSMKLSREMELRLILARENNLKDSAFSREREFNILLERENKLKIQQLENERELKAAISRENALMDIRLDRERKLRMQLIVGSALLLICGFAIFLLYRRQRSKNLIIQQQADDLQVLMKEIHHRVKNNLQVISSLLDLQALSIGSGPASAAIRESRDRVYSMALIHQHLYREDYMRGIDMSEYLARLAEGLFQSYNAGNANIKLATDIDPVKLEIDQVIPIGLIVNELVSNALKYAFPKGKNGTLKVSLKKKDEGLLLQVCDDGNGFPQGTKFFQAQSFGFRLIRAFAQKLKATVDAYNDNGACVSVSIRKIKTV